LTSTDYAATRGAENLFTSTLDSWRKGLGSFAEQVRAFSPINAFPQMDATEAVDRQYAFLKQIVDLNHEYARSLAESVNTLTGAARRQFESVGNTVRDQVQEVSNTARSGVDTLERTVHEQARQAERVETEAREAAEDAERQQAREAAKAERQQRQQARNQARQRYESLTKTELSDEAGKRGLPKTGTVEELVARLVEDDTKDNGQ
jgi:F0F1-type ATP synthase membrane subunit b/b'